MTEAEERWRDKVAKAGQPKPQTLKRIAQGSRVWGLRV